MLSERMKNLIDYALPILGFVLAIILAALRVADFQILIGSGISLYGLQGMLRRKVFGKQLRNGGFIEGGLAIFLGLIYISLGIMIIFNKIK
jgi:hypothetical protein